jgi:hypothetical protein
MLPPVPVLVSCPKCSKLFKVYDNVSGNTLGATYWSDGWVDAPMMPEERVVIVCPHCRDSIWREDCPDSRPTDTGSEPEPWEYRANEYDDEYRRYAEYAGAKKAGPVRFAKMLRTPIDNPDRERYLRIQLWWNANHARRKSLFSSPELLTREKHNMALLATMLDEGNEHDLIMKAELMRELGRLRQAALLLSKLPSNSHPFAKEITRLVQQGDSCVRQVAAPDDGSITIYA